MPSLSTSTVADESSRQAVSIITAASMASISFTEADQSNMWAAAVPVATRAFARFRPKTRGFDLSTPGHSSNFLPLGAKG